MKKILLFILAGFCINAASAQVSELKDASQLTVGSVVYALPKTTIKIKIELDKEVFVAGPYAQYAQKYLGINADTQNKESYFMRGVEMLPFQEADASAQYVINFGSMKNARANFLEFTSSGLVLPTDYTKQANLISRFVASSNQGGSFLDNGVKSNFMNETTTYYNTVSTDSGVMQIPMERTQKVAKSLETKAEEAADLIYTLRSKRIDIVTGEADITDGLEALINENRRLEKEYISLFVGKTVRTRELVYVDVIPEENQSKQSYIAFRFSESQGIVSSTNVGGRPIILDLELEKTPVHVDMSRSESSKQAQLYYRVPRIVVARLLNGQEVLLQDRLPVYQLGSILSIPADLQIK